MKPPGVIITVTPPASAESPRPVRMCSHAAYIAVSADGAYLYSLNAATGAIGIFAIRATDGTLTNLGTLGGLPANAGLNGIAAN